MLLFHRLITRITSLIISFRVEVGIRTIHGVLNIGEVGFGLDVMMRIIIMSGVMLVEFVVGTGGEDGVEIVP